MDRDELLNTFKKENKDGDERSIYLKERCYSFTFKILISICVVLMTIENIMNIKIQIELGVVLLFIISVYSLFSFIWLKKTYSLIIAVTGAFGVFGYYYHLLTGSFLL